ncbi:hypothetical protein KEJ15_03735 [Candidatus Bathyarchaeota archaeon]|nr:hypothetical protein [Candidatus Bathyarchaeota archaeon]
MVREKKLDDKTVYLCGVCGLGYPDWETARKCEEWCKKTGEVVGKGLKKGFGVVKAFGKGAKEAVTKKEKEEK